MFKTLSQMALIPFLYDPSKLSEATNIYLMVKQS